MSVRKSATPYVLLIGFFIASVILLSNHQRKVSAQSVSPTPAVFLAGAGAPAVSCDASLSPSGTSAGYIQTDAAPGQALWICTTGTGWQQRPSAIAVLTSPVITWGSILSGTCTTTTVGLSSALTTQAVDVNPIGDIGDGNVRYRSWVSSNGVVSIRLCNYALTSASMNAVAWRILVY